MKVTRLLPCALFGVATLALMSCGDSSPLGVSSRAPTPTAGLVTSLEPSASLLTCSPLPYDSVTLTVGSLGGTLKVGPHTLSVPAGALDAPVTVTAVAPADTVSQVRFQPEGLTFAQPASLTMSYANCDLLGSTLPKQIAYVSDELEILELLLSLDNAEAREVRAELSHFSGYAVAW